MLVNNRGTQDGKQWRMALEWYSFRLGRIWETAAGLNCAVLVGLYVHTYDVAGKQEIKTGSLMNEIECSCVS